ncbi:MAG: Gfo/Idh/MocA family oxidoreductase [Anaerolineae bacterium]
MKVRWGVLGTAKIALENVIPAMQAGEYCQIEAIASRDMARAKEAARWLGIPRAYGSYEALLDDGEIDAVYIPLPNHLHVPWSLNALEAGKHVLCEKPIGLSAAEAQQLLIASEDRPQLKAMEAFMYRFHPQWRRAHQIVTEGGVGELQAIQSFFAYHNVDPDNIRNQPDIGGGALMDIGCYCVSLSRWLFGAEPERVLGMIEYDPEFGTDRLTSGLLDFGRGRATFTCATQLSEYQRVNVVGDEGRVEIEIPFNAPPDRPCRIWHHRGDEVEEIAFEAVNQYTLQGDLFSQAILEDGEVPTSLEDGVANMSVIEAVVRSAREGGWVW